MNEVFLMGNVGQDPKVTDFEGGGKVAQFGLATTERWTRKKEDGTTEKVEDTTQWHNIVAGRTGIAKVVEQYVKKGTQLLIRGHLRNRKYQKRDGTEGYITEVMIDDMTLLGKREGGCGVPAPEQEPDRGRRDVDDLPF